MDQDTARVLFEDGATLVLLDVPEGTEFGVDYTSWNVGPKFKGLKMIPPGVHFIYYSACNSSGQASPRTGFFHHFSRGEMLVRRWDRQTEDISTLEVSEEECQRMRDNKHQLDEFLGPYPYDNYKTWVSLSSHVTPSLVERLQPVTGRVNSVTQFLSERSDSQSRQNKMESEELHIPARDQLPHLAVIPGTSLRFTPVPKRGFPLGSSASQITQHNLDSSFAIDDLISKYQHQDEILGEIQFAFICFLIGQVGDAFEQWKKLVHLLCSSQEAVIQKPDLYLKFITVLFYHLKEVPQDFFVDIVSSDNFLVRTLHGLFLALEDERTDSGLKRRGAQFKNHLTKKFKWDFSEEPADEAPVIVELGDNNNENS